MTRGHRHRVVGVTLKLAKVVWSRSRVMSKSSLDYQDWELIQSNDSDHREILCCVDVCLTSRVTQHTYITF